MTGLDAAKSIVETLSDAGYTALFAGGCVRDRLLGLEPVDYDVATSATPDDVRKLFRKTKLVGAQFGVVLVRVKRVEVEVATFRTDGSYGDGRRPDSVQFATPEEDAKRRDFTVNGMFLNPFTDEIVDYVGGREDLDRRVIRCIGDPDARFSEDHLRLLRAVRFAARLGFALEAGTRDAIIRHAPRISAISAERIRMELELMLTHPTRTTGWRMIWETQLADHLAPGLQWTESSAERCARILEGLPQTVSIPLGMAAILVGFDVKHVRDACRDLRCSSTVCRAVEYLVTTSARVLSHDPWELADVKFLMASGLGNDVLALSKSIAQAEESGSERVSDLAARAARISPSDYAPPPLVTGDDLIAMHLPAGPRFREVLDTLYRAQLNGELIERDAALAHARVLIAN